MRTRILHFLGEFAFLRTSAPNDFPIILTGRIIQRGRSYEPTLHRFFVGVFRERSGDRAIFRDAEKSREPRVWHTGELKHSVITRLCRARTVFYDTRAFCIQQHPIDITDDGADRFVQPGTTDLPSFFKSCELNLETRLSKLYKVLFRKDTKLASLSYCSKNKVYYSSYKLSPFLLF